MMLDTEFTFWELVGLGLAEGLLPSRRVTRTSPTSESRSHSWPPSSPRSGCAEYPGLRRPGRHRVDGGPGGTPGDAGRGRTRETRSVLTRGTHGALTELASAALRKINRPWRSEGGANALNC